MGEGFSMTPNAEEPRSTVSIERVAPSGKIARKLRRDIRDQDSEVMHLVSDAVANFIELDTKVREYDERAQRGNSDGSTSQ